MQQNIFIFFSTLNAAIKRNQVEIKVKPCRLTKLLLYFLRENGYINGFIENEGVIIVLVKYFQSRPVLKQIIPVSKPGRKVYASVLSLNKLTKRLSANAFNKKLSFTIPLIFHKGRIYTPKHVQRFFKGGELLCLLAI